MVQHSSSIRLIRKVELVDKGDRFVPPFDRVKNVMIVPFTQEDKLVCGIQNGRIVLPGRRTQIYDQDCFDTLRHELREGVGIVTGELKLLKVLESNYYGSQPEQLTYIVVFAALAKKFLYATTDSVTRRQLARKVVSLDTFFREHKSSNRKLIEELVFAGRKLAFDPSPSHPIIEEFKVDRLKMKLEQEQIERRSRKSWLYDNWDNAAGVSISTYLKRRDMWIYC